MHRYSLQILSTVFLILVFNTGCSTVRPTLPTVVPIHTQGSIVTLIPLPSSTPIPAVTSNPPTEAVSSGVAIHLAAGVTTAILRSGPGIEFPSVGELKEGQIASLMGRSAQNDWLQITLDGQEGWIFASLVEVTGDLFAVPYASGEEPVKPALEIPGLETALANIRAISGQADLPLELLEESPNPNAIDHRVIVFNDNQGRQFSVDSQTLQVVEFVTLTGRGEIDPDNIKELVELRTIAEQFARQNSIQFAELLDSLTYREGSKDGTLTFFRWENQNVAWKHMPPLIQVGIDLNGEILVYLNTLDILE